MIKNKKNILILGLILLLIIAIIGVSYAVFNYSALGTKVNTITTGSITMTYTETENVINLSGALPTTDKTGKTLSDYFEFTVSSNITGDVNINYEISAKKESGTLEDRYIKLYLTRVTESGEEELMTPEVYNEEASSNSYTGRPANEMSLYTSSMNSSESNTYRLRMYVDESYNPQGDGGGKTFSVRVNVYGLDRAAEPVSDVLLANIPEENLYNDGVDTFITGEDPNNYIWYSGKLWRAVSVNNVAKTTKLVTQWNISTIPYDDDSSAFEGSYMKDWLNDTTVDGFLGNLRDYENFIETDSVWNATETTETTKPAETTMVTTPVGLLNIYEYTMSYSGTDYSNGYLNNGLNWWLITPYNLSDIWHVANIGESRNGVSTITPGIRPSINLKSSIKIAAGDGTIDNPYRLSGDNDTNLSGTLLSSRYSGEYIRFGNDENNLYRIVSHESGRGTKIVSAEPLKNSGEFIKSLFGNNTTFSSGNIIGEFLNVDYLTNYVDSIYVDMIEDSSTWYLGTVGNGESYKLAKYTDTNMSSITSSTTSAKVGLLRLGELMSGQFERRTVKNGSSSTGLTISYWTITPNNSLYVNGVRDFCNVGADSLSISAGIRPSINLKSNVVITGGDGTKNRPFTIELAS